MPNVPSAPTMAECQARVHAARAAAAAATDPVAVRDWCEVALTWERIARTVEAKRRPH